MAKKLEYKCGWNVRLNYSEARYPLEKNDITFLLKAGKEGYQHVEIRYEDEDGTDFSIWKVKPTKTAIEKFNDHCNDEVCKDHGLEAYDRPA